MNNDAHREAYLEEAREHLLQLEEALLELEEAPEDMELIGRVFRSMHTIKGSGAMFGFDNIAEFTHEVETVYDLIREGKLAVTKEIIDLSLKARDCIRMMLNNEDTDATLIEEVRSACKKINDQGLTPVAKAEKAKGPIPASSDKQVTYLIRFRPHRDLFETGTNPVPLLRELQEMGTCEITAQIDAIPSLPDCEPEKCYVFWDIILTTDAGMNAIKDVFIFVEDLADIEIEIIDKMMYSEEEHKKLGQILVERGDLSLEDLKKTLKDQKRIGELLVDRGIVSPDKVQAALSEQEQIKKKKEKQQSEESISSIRVAAPKLDTLVDLVGELVTVQARLTQKANAENDPDLIIIAEQVEHLTAELRENAMSMRMLPIGTTFGRFKRLVRDLSSELGKEIELITDGAETELDKTVIEKLNDPLVHLIRNSIDHGIETPDVRESLNKQKVGTIRLSALHSGAHVVVRIQDDGKGLDREAILAKALEKGLVMSGTELSDDEVYSFIFHPGFSTAKEVTNVSGRGVGMDVVKKAIIDSLKGSIDIASEKGKGTTVTIKLPLTLAIVEGLLVKIAEDSFVLPLSVVEECVELTKEDREKSHSGNLAHIRGEIVPYIRLRREFGMSEVLPDIEQIVVTATNGTRVGLVVDSVIGEHQTVIKNLGRMYRDVEGISGATVLGDGTVALIVDVPRLLDKMELAEAVFG